MVISGDEEPVQAVAEEVAGLGRRSRRLRVSHAFHSAHMDPVIGEFRDVVAGLTLREPTIPIVSNVTGALASAEQLRSPEYWVRQLRGTVRYLDGIGHLTELGVGCYLELAPHPVLTQPTTHVVGDDAAVIPTLHAREPEAMSLLIALARIHLRAINPDWTALIPSSHQVNLPTYPFQQQSYWIGAPGSPERAHGHEPTADTGFWSAVEHEDLAGLADQLQLDREAQQQLLGPLLPALSAWRRSRTWWHRAAWEPMARGLAPALSGSWPLITAAGEYGDFVSAIAEGLAARGAKVTPIEVKSAGGGEDPLDILSGQPELAGVLMVPGPDSDASLGAAQVGELKSVLGSLSPAIPLWIVTCGAVSTGPGDPIADPARSWWRSLAGQLRRDHPGRHIGLVDVPETLAARTAAGLAGALAGRHDNVALRESGLYARRLIRTPIPAEDARYTWPQPGGTVLVTGAASAPGGDIADWLVRSGARQVLLAVPPDDDANIAGLADAITVARCDPGDRDALAALLDGIDGAHPLRAVFHSARGGAPADRNIAAALNLHELTGRRDLTAFVLSGPMADAGPGDEVTAYHEALAAHRRSQNLPATSLSWDLLSDRAIRPGLALRGLPQALNGVSAYVVADLPAQTAGTNDDDPEPNEAAVLLNRLAGCAADERLRILVELVQAKAAALLGQDSASGVAEDGLLLEAGLTSLTAIELRNELSRATGLELPTTAVYDQPTPIALAEYLNTSIT